MELETFVRGQKFAVYSQIKS